MPRGGCCSRPGEASSKWRSLADSHRLRLSAAHLGAATARPRGICAARGTQRAPCSVWIRRVESLSGREGEPMHRVIELPNRVREIENLWVPLSDGVRLAARV